MRRIGGKRLIAWCSTVLTIVSMARVLVLFLEAVAVVRDERRHDHELLELCSGGAARGSAKMRSACLQAHAERASPILLKAIVRAISTAWMEFAETIASPLGFASVVLFIFSSLLLPIVPWARAVLTAWAGEDDENEQNLHRDGDLETHVIVLNGDDSWAQPKSGMRRKLARRIVGQQPKIRASACVGSGWEEDGVRFSGI